MTDRQKILDEIKRLKEWEPIAIPQAQRRKEIQCARLGVLIGLEDFINSLPAEQDKTNASRKAITMPLAERIKDKIEQLKGEASYHENVQSVLNKLKVYIDIISTEQPSEELEKAAAALTNEIVGELNVWDYTDHSGHNSHWHSFKEGVVAGAKWQKEQTISKACEWLNKNVVEYHPRKGQLRPIVNINAFREAMEN